MSTRLVLRGLAVFCALVLVAVLAITAAAQQQQSPLRVGQGSDGTLYLVQGGNSWTLVPDQLSDSDVAGLNPSGEVDGVIPNQFLVGPEPPPVAAPPPAPTPTQTPAAAPAPAPAPPPSTAPNVLYQADWSSGFNGWTGGRDWKTVAGMLVTDGSLGYSETIAPYRAPTADYSVAAEIQNLGGGYGTGLLVRRDQSGSYYGAMGPGPGGFTCIGIAHADCIGPRNPFNDAGGWHTYRIDARGNHLSLFIDGYTVNELTDNRFLTGGGVGLVTSSVQFQVRSFKVLAP